MKLDDVFLMAKKAGFTPQECLTWGNEIQRLASLVAAHEREECAKVCEAEHLEDPYDREDDAYDCAVNDCARAIRNRGNA